jgi:glycosyltransferase involved in cell wall biosynthesis
MSRILVVVERFFPEDFLVNDLVAELLSRGEEVEVLTQVPSYPFDKIYDGYENKPLQTTLETLPLLGSDKTFRVKVHRVSTVFGYNSSVKRKILNYVHFGWKTFLWAMRNGNGYDKVFVYHTAALLMASSVFAFKFRRKKPVSIWTQDLWPDAVWGFGFKKTKVREFFLNAFVRSIYSCCDRLMVSCRGFVPRIAEICGRKADFVPQWDTMDDRVFAGSDENGQGREGDKIFMFAGNLGKPQNLENILNGFALANPKGAQLHFVGGGVMFEPLKETVKEKKRPNVVFHGRQPRSDMPNWYKKASALVISLTAEYKLTLPGKFQSYIKTGKPLIGVLLGDAAEMIEEHSLGVVSDPSDVSSIAEAFRKMNEMLDAGEGAECGKRARELSATLFNRKVLIDELLR